jgi:hypothetical protein
MLRKPSTLFRALWRQGRASGAADSLADAAAAPGFHAASWCMAGGAVELVGSAWVPSWHSRPVNRTNSAVFAGQDGYLLASRCA